MSGGETEPVQPRRPASKLGQFSWALFDWAGQPFFTVITTFIFAPYFTSTVVGDPVKGQALWGYTQAAAGFAIALLCPILGAVADAGGRRKPWTLTFVALCVAGSFSLWWAVPGMQPPDLWLILLAIVLATIGAEFSIVFNNAMLPDIAQPERMGRLSGFGWGLGYLGGLAALFIVLFGFSMTDTPLFGLDKAAHEHDRVVGPMSAVWFLLFVIPLFLFTPDRESAGLGRATAVREGLRTLKKTLTSIGRYRNVLWFLIARNIYNDGILAIIGFSGIYAAGIFGWTTTTLGIFGIIVTVFAIIGAFTGGWLDDRLGSKPTAVISVLGLAVATVGVISISQGQVLFAFPAAMPTPESGLLESPAERVFMAFGIIIGIFLGPAQAASRTLLARIAPKENIAEFYGLYALSGKATAFLAPLLIGLVTSATGQQRPGLVVVFLFLIVGAALMSFVREKEDVGPVAGAAAPDRATPL